MQARLARQFPDTDRRISVELVPLKRAAVGGVGPSLWLLFGAVSVLLLIACINIATLLLSRGMQRRHELAIRLSLGASRAAVAAHVLTETLLLALAGGALGLLIAWLAASSLRAVAAGLPRVDEVVLDSRVLAYCTATTLGVAFLCGLLPAIRTARERAGGLAASERTLVAARHSLPWTLVGAQVALSVTLLAGAGLLVRSLRELARVEPGFESSHVLSFRMSGNWGETADYPALIARIDGTLEALRRLPSVEAAATTGWALPGVPTKWESTLDLVESSTDAGRRIVAEFRSVSPEYFETLRIPLVAGERLRAAPRRRDGRRARLGPDGQPRVRGPLPVGLPVARRAPPGRGRGRGEPGPDRRRGGGRPGARARPRSRPDGVRVPERPEPHPVLPGAHECRAARDRADDPDEDEGARAAAVGLRHRSARRADRRGLRRGTPPDALTALSLAGVGLYGTLSYLVGLRRREVGLRIALGAVRSDIVRQFLAQGMRVAALACLCGLGLALALRRVVAGLLFGVSATDAVTLSGVVVLVLGVSSLASLLPAARAARTEPMRVLRES